MPTLMLRALERDLLARVKVYARTHTLSTSAAAAQLLTIALDHLAARSAGGQAMQEGRTDEERTAAARHAARARWAGRDDLLSASRLALAEMCHTVAPRDSFTDAVDALDAAISKADGSPEPAKERG